MESEFVIGTVTFLAVKFFGYRYAGITLNRTYSSTKPIWPSLFGLLRMLLGLLASSGSAYALGYLIDSRPWLPIIYLLLVPVRLSEWIFIIWLFYERRSGKMNTVRLLRYSLSGTAWTYALDIPAIIAALIIPGGFPASFC